MSVRVYAIVMFMLGSTLLSVVVAQARQFMPSLKGGKSANRKRLAIFPRSRRKVRGGRLFYPVPSPGEVNELVAGTANQYEVDPQLVRAIITVESGYNTNAVSRRGARGLMQLIPDTAKRFGVKNPFNPQQNIAGGVAFLKHLLQRFSGDVPLSVAAYNAGENAVLRQGGVPPYPETIEYVRKVTSLYRPELIISVTQRPFAGS